MNTVKIGSGTQRVPLPILLDSDKGNILFGFDKYLATHSFGFRYLQS